MRTRILWEVISIALVLVGGLIIVHQANATTCQPDDTMVVVCGTWTYPQGMIGYCIGRCSNCEVTAYNSDIPKNGDMVKLNGTLTIEKTPKGEFYHFDATDTLGTDTVYTQCDEWK